MRRIRTLLRSRDWVLEALGSRTVIPVQAGIQWISNEQAILRLHPGK